MARSVPKGLHSFSTELGYINLRPGTSSAESLSPRAQAKAAPAGSFPAPLDPPTARVGEVLQSRHKSRAPPAVFNACTAGGVGRWAVESAGAVPAPTAPLPARLGIFSHRRGFPGEELGGLSGLQGCI